VVPKSEADRHAAALIKGWYDSETGEHDDETSFLGRPRDDTPHQFSAREVKTHKGMPKVRAAEGTWSVPPESCSERRIVFLE